MFNILRYKYHVNSSYDPCSYPGIQCIYYYDTNNNKISYMIFRTGSILIVGKCDEKILNEAYEYIKNILYTEYYNIYTNDNTLIEKKSKKTCKLKKKIIYIK